MSIFKRFDFLLPVLLILLAATMSVCPEAAAKTASKADTKVMPAQAGDQTAGNEAEGPEVQDNTLPTLKSILELRIQLKSILKDKKRQLKRASSESEKERLLYEIERLNKQLTKSRNDFDRIAAGIDVSMFQDRKDKKFDWKEEITALVKPALNEMKRLTAKVRQKSQLNMELEHAGKLLPEAEEAVKNIKQLISETQDKAVKQELKKELKDWENRVKQLTNELAIAKM